MIQGLPLMGCEKNKTITQKGFSPPPPTSLIGYTIKKVHIWIDIED